MRVLLQTTLRPGKFGQGKRSYGFNDVKDKLNETLVSQINKMLSANNLNKLIQVTEKALSFFVLF